MSETTEINILDQLTNQEQAAQEAYNRLIDNRKRDWGLYGHDTGIHPLNLAIGGWIPSKVTTIAARSGIGKSAFIIPFAEAANRVINGKRAELLIFTWEMLPSLLIDRYVCSQVGITQGMLNQGAKLLGDATMKSVMSAYGKAMKFPVKYHEMSTNLDEVVKYTEEFVSRCEEKEKVEGVKIQPVVVIDYVGMAKFQGSEKRTYGIAEFMNGIKQCANSTKAAFVVLAQLTRASDNREVPTRADLSDSKSIEDASDNLILLHRPEYNYIREIKNPETGEVEDSEDKMLMRVMKGRDFGTGDKVINCQVRHFRFWDRWQDYKYEYWHDYSDKDFWIRHFGFDN